MTGPDSADQPPSRRQRIAGVAAFGAIFAISIATIFGGELLQSSEANRSRAVDLDLLDVDSGERIRTNEKNPTVIRFLDAACASCDPDLGVLERSQRRWNNKVNYVIISAGDEETVRETFRTADSSVHVASDPDEVTAEAYRVDELPATVFVTAGGQILERDDGPLGEDALERRIRAVIAAGTGG